MYKYQRDLQMVDKRIAEQLNLPVKPLEKGSLVLNGNDYYVVLSIPDGDYKGMNLLLGPSYDVTTDLSKATSAWAYIPGENEFPWKIDPSTNCYI